MSCASGSGGYCRFTLRASWFAQELLSTFSDDLGEAANGPSLDRGPRLYPIGEVVLTPGTGGILEIRLTDEVLWSKAVGRYPEPKEIKQLIRDRIDPARDLGHSDRK